MLNEPNVEEQSQRTVQQIKDELSGERVRVVVEGYVEGVGTMGSTLAVEEWDGGTVRIRIGTDALAKAEKVRGAGEVEGAGE
jgi:hypothetical protein